MESCLFVFVLTAEFLFLLWGVYLCYAVRTVPSAFHEPRYMAVAVHNELIISAIFHTIRQVIYKAKKYLFYSSDVLQFNLDRKIWLMEI